MAADRIEPVKRQVTEEMEDPLTVLDRVDYLLLRDAVHDMRPERFMVSNGMLWWSMLSRFRLDHEVKMEVRNRLRHRSGDVG